MKTLVYTVIVIVTIVYIVLNVANTYKKLESSIPVKVVTDPIVLEGLWYNVATTSKNDCKCKQNTTYRYISDKYLRIECLDGYNITKDIRGSGSKLETTYNYGVFDYFWDDHWIVYYSPSGSIHAFSDRQRNTLTILSRTEVVNEAEFDDAMVKLASNGFKVYTLMLNTTI